jgi:hypothetical protein
VVPFAAIMEADLLLWYRTAIAADQQRVWYPRTLVYLPYNQRFSLFQRARGAGVFATLGPVLGVLDRESFVRRFREIPQEIGHYYPIGDSKGGPREYARFLGIDDAP